MKFERVEVARYGCFEDFATPDSLPSLVVVLGPNESGKSTFFSLLGNLIFGFHPATRDNHPYTPRTGGDPEATARIRLEDGAVLEVHRRLTSRPHGRLSTHGGDTQDIRNRPLAAASHVKRGMFRHAYALTLAELASLEGESWAIIQDRLVAALGMKGLKPSRKVADSFDVEANRLWRPDKRGRPRVRVLQEELAQLYESRRAAEETDRALRDKVAALADAELLLSTIDVQRENEREQSKVAERRLTRLLPVRRDLMRIQELRVEAGPEEALEELTRDPVSCLRDLQKRREEADQRVEKLDHEARICRETVEGFDGSNAEAMLAAEERIRSAIGEMRALPALERDVVSAKAEVAAMRDLVDQECLALFNIPWDELATDALERVSLETLQDRARQCETAEAKLQEAKEAERDRSLLRLPDATRPGPGWLIGGAAALVVGAAVGLWPIMLPERTFVWSNMTIPPTVGLSVAIILGVSSVFMFYSLWSARRRYVQYRSAVAEAEKLRDDRLRELLEQKVQATDGVAEALAELPVRGSLLKSPTLDLSAGISRLIGLVDRHRQREKALAELRKEVKRVQLDVRQVRVWVSARLGGQAATDADSLGSVLDGAVKGREARHVAAQQLTRIEAERIEAGKKQVAADQELRAYKAALEAFAPGDAERGAEIAASRLDAGRRAEELQAELRRNNPALEDLEGEIAEADADGAAWDSLPQRLEEIAANQDRLAAEAEQMQAEIGRLKSEIGHLRQGESVTAAQGRIDAVQEEVRAAKRSRDRAFVLARVVRVADRRFRDANQPELLRRAGRYLGQVTDGRYDRIEVGDVGDESFYLREPSGGSLVRVGETTSQGTKEQVYMALRLAVVNHLDSGREPLPIFLDETLVNWDAWRRDRALDLLEQLANERQVFVFTCHPAMAAEIEDRGGTIIPLTVD